MIHTSEDFFKIFLKSLDLIVKGHDEQFGLDAIYMFCHFLVLYYCCYQLFPIQFNSIQLNQDVKFVNNFDASYEIFPLLKKHTPESFQIIISPINVIIAVIFMRLLTSKLRSGTERRNFIKSLLST